MVCGPSGSGKSTLIKTVNALEPFQKGDIVVDGVSHLPTPRPTCPSCAAAWAWCSSTLNCSPTCRVTENLTLAQIKVLGPQRRTTLRRAA